MRLLLPSAIAACAIGAFGCGSDPVGPSGRVVASIALTPSTFVLYQGGSRTLTAVARDAADSAIPGITFTWSSRTPAIASVSSAGVVTAVGIGVDTLTATSGTVVGMAVVTVTAVPVDSVVVTPGTATIHLTQTRQLTATPGDSAGHALTGRTITWASSDSARATVSGTGLVSALQVGGVTITATVEGHLATAALTIDSIPVTSVALVPLGDTVVVGDTLAPVAVAKDSAGHPVAGHTATFGVSDSSVLQPIGGGRFVALTSGDVTLSASIAGHGTSGPIAARACADTLQKAVGSFSFPLVSGGLATDASGTIDIGLFKSAAAWYGGGVMFGTDSAHMVVAYDPSLNLGPGAAPRGVCVLSNGPPYVRSSAKVSPLTGLTGPAGLRVVQESFHSNSTSADSAFILFRYTFTDTSATSISGLRVGFIMDWDLGVSPGSNLLTFDGTYTSDEAVEQDSVGHTERLGIAAFTTAGSPMTNGWLNGADPTTRGAYYSLLGQPTQGVTVGPGDVRALAGVAPITIPAYGRVVVYFAIAGGTTPAKYATSLAAAHALANSLGYN